MPSARREPGDVLRVEEEVRPHGVSELRERRLLRDENARLKRLVADLTLDKQILSDVVKKKSEAGASQSLGGMDESVLPRKHPARVRLIVFLAGRLLSEESLGRVGKFTWVQGLMAGKTVGDFARRLSVHLNQILQ